MTAVPPPPKPVPPPPKPPGPPRRSFLFGLFLAALAWTTFSGWISASSATGLCERFNLPALQPVLSPLFWIFLLLVGFSMFQTLARQGSSPQLLLGLPQRSTAPREWTLGAVLGWGSAVAIVLPLALTRALHVQVSFAPRDLGLTLLSLIGLGLLAFAEETAFRGYPYRLLTQVTGPSLATMLMALWFGVFCAMQPSSTTLSTLVSIVLGLVLTVGWRRTHALWLSWGFNFAFKAAAAILFGLPVEGATSYSYLVQTYPIGSRAWTGGSYGLPGSWLALVVLLCALIVLIRLTRDYAWNYTHRPIAPGGYPVEVAPPAAHTAMEQAAAQPPPLVQILPSTPTSQSLLPHREPALPSEQDRN